MTGGGDGGVPAGRGGTGPDSVEETVDPHVQVTDDLAGRTITGLQWTYAAIAISAVLQVAYTAAMGRLLDPRAYGLVASANILLKLGQLVAEMGLGPALVQRPQLDRAELRAAFTSSVLLGGVLAAAMAAMAPLGAELFDDPSLTGVIRAMAAVLLLNALGLTGVSLLRRQLRFKVLAIIEVSSYLIGYLGVGLTSALLGAGVWSLVAASVTQVGLQAAAAYVATRHPVAPLLAWRRLRAFYSFGFKVSLLVGLENASYFATSIVIGRQGGLRVLGQYNRASLLIELPLGHLTTGLVKVLFPAMSRIQDDRPRVARAYLSALRVSGSLMVPMAAGVAVAAPQVVRVVLGDQWDVAAVLLPPVAVGAVLAVLSTFGGVVCEALALLNAKLVLQTTTVLLVIGGLLLVPSERLVLYAVVVAAGEAFRHLAYVVFLHRALGLDRRDHVAAYVPLVVAGLAVGAAIWVVTTVGEATQVPLVLLLVAQIATGVAVLSVLLWFGPLRGIRDEIHDRVAAAASGDRPALPIRAVLAYLAVGAAGRPGRRS